MAFYFDGVLVFFGGGLVIDFDGHGLNKDLEDGGVKVVYLVSTIPIYLKSKQKFYHYLKAKGITVFFFVFSSLRCWTCHKPSMSESNTIMFTVFMYLFEDHFSLLIQFSRNLIDDYFNLNLFHPISLETISRPHRDT